MDWNCALAQIRLFMTVTADKIARERLVLPIVVTKQMPAAAKSEVDVVAGES